MAKIDERDLPAMPQGSHRWNRAHRGAFRKGMIAQRMGTPRENNPYKDTRKTAGQLTWSRSFISAWLDGWRWANKHPVKVPSGTEPSGHP